jgi:hypothetical protein
MNGSRVIPYRVDYWHFPPTNYYGMTPHKLKEIINSDVRDHRLFTIDCNYHFTTL